MTTSGDPKDNPPTPDPKDKTDPKTTEDPKPPVDPKSDPASDDNEKLRKIVREELSKAIPSMHSGEQNGTRSQDIAREAQRMVEEAASKAKLENAVEELDKKVKAVAEAPPKVYRRLTIALWGKGE